MDGLIESPRDLDECTFRGKQKVKNNAAHFENGLALPMKGFQEYSDRMAGKKEHEWFWRSYLKPRKIKDTLICGKS